MNDERAPESEERSWLDRLTHFISGEPQNKTDLEGVLSLAEEHEIIDEDARKIMEGALSVSDMQVRDIMIPRAQMVVIDSDQPLQEALPKILQSGHSRYPAIGEGIDLVEGDGHESGGWCGERMEDRGWRIEGVWRPTTVAHPVGTRHVASP